MSRDQIITGLDIGTHAIRTVVARLVNGKLQVMGTGEALANGIRRGVVVDIEEAVKSIRGAVEKAEQTVGFPIEGVYVGVGGSHITSRESKGVVAVSKADGDISEEDALRVISAASAVSLQPNREIIHVVPRFFIVDGQSGIQDPVGMNGVRLEVGVMLIEGGTPFLRNVNKCVEEAGLKIEETVFGPLAASKSILSKKQKELGVVALDIGGGTTDLSVFEEGYFMHMGVIPLGSSLVTNDIAIGLKTGVDIAERVKLEYGASLAGEINKKDKIDLINLGMEESESVHRRQVVEIIEARMTEIFELVNKQLKKIDRQGLLPAGVVLYGAGAKLPGIIDLIKKELRLPTQLGFPKELGGMPDKVDDPSFATAVGLALWGAQNGKGKNIPGDNTKRKIKNWFRALLP